MCSRYRRGTVTRSQLHLIALLFFGRFARKQAGKVRTFWVTVGHRRYCMSRSGNIVKSRHPGEPQPVERNERRSSEEDDEEEGEGQTIPYSLGQGLNYVFDFVNLP